MKKLFKKKLYYFSFFLFLFSALACTHEITDSDYDGIPDTRDSCSTTPVGTEVNTLGCPIQINDIHLVLDNSGSIKGYTSYDKDGFIQNITDILARIDGSRDMVVGNTNFYTTGNKDSHFELSSTDIQKFTNDFPSLIADYGSYLHVAFDSLASIVEKDTSSIGIFVTDGILSIESGLGNQNNLYKLNANIQYASNRLAKKKCGVSIYQFSSKFKGQYTTYLNQKQFIQTDRPYYMIVIGSNSLLRKFTKKIVVPNIEQRAMNEIHWRLPKENSLSYSIYPKVLEGEAFFDGNKWDNIPKGANSISFLVGLNMSKLPNYLKHRETMDDMLRLSPMNGQSSVKYFTKNEIMKSEFSSLYAPDKDFWQQNDGFILVNLRGGIPKSIYLSLQNPLAKSGYMPTWVKRYSTDDDTNVKDIVVTEKRTFGLERMINAFMQSFQEGEEKEYCGIKIDFN